MKAVKVRDITIGEGIPGICVPIVGTTREEILQEARLITGMPADVAEFRADYYEDVLDYEKLEAILFEIRQIIGNMPLLMTLRTLEEGGCSAFDISDYSEINIRASQNGVVDMIDVELMRGDEVVRGIIESAHEAGVKVIVSNHDFECNPPEEEIIERLRRMQQTGADIIKIAVMPRARRDVIRLLAAADEMADKYLDRPAIIISMGEEGIVTRAAGEIFGSAMTFACASRPSAPGQITAYQLKDVLTALHGILRNDR